MKSTEKTISKALLEVWEWKDEVYKDIKGKTLKKSDPKADTSILETEIDRLVYELYGLTEEEIAIVEGSLKGAK